MRARGPKQQPPARPRLSRSQRVMVALGAAIDECAQLIDELPVGRRRTRAMGWFVEMRKVQDDIAFTEAEEPQE